LNSKENIAPHYPYLGEIKTSIGSLAVFMYRVKDMIAMSEKSLGKNSSEIDAATYVRRLVSILCYPLDLIENYQEPEKQALSEDDVACLSFEDLDSFSQVLLANSEYLFRESIENTRYEDDKTIVSHEFGEIVNPQLESERLFEYLYRLFVLDEKKWKEKAKINLFNTGISDTFLKQIEQTSKIGSAINKQLEALTPLTRTVNFDATEKLAKAAEPIKGIGKMVSPALATTRKPLLTIPDDILFPEDKLSPTAELLEQIEADNKEKREREERAFELSEISVQRSNEQLEVMKSMSIHMESLNQNQIQSAKDSSISDAKSHSISWAVLIITFLGLCAALYSTFLAYQSAQLDSSLQIENTQLRNEIKQKDQQFEEQNQRIADLEVALTNIQKESSSPKETTAKP